MQRDELIQISELGSGSDYSEPHPQPPPSWLSAPLVLNPNIYLLPVPLRASVCVCMFCSHVGA